MSQRGKAIWRFLRQALMYAVLALFVLYIVGLLAKRHTSAEFFAGLASQWFVFVPLFLAVGVVWALWARWTSRWAKRREPRNADGGKSGGAK